jgi:hypothetical protein
MNYILIFLNNDNFIFIITTPSTHRCPLNLKSKADFDQEREIEREINDIIEVKIKEKKQYPNLQCLFIFVILID